MQGPADKDFESLFKGAAACPLRNGIPSVIRFLATYAVGSATGPRSPWGVSVAKRRRVLGIAFGTPEEQTRRQPIATGLLVHTM